MPRKVSTDIALLIFLTLIVAVIIFPILGNLPPSEQELAMLRHIAAEGGAGTIASIFDAGSNIFVETYTHVVQLLQGLLPLLPPLLALRLPGAITMMVLTLCLFQFGGGIDRFSSSFLASLLFLSCALVLRFTLTATEVVIPAAWFILALMSLYHWLHRPRPTKFWLVVLTAGIATVLIGATAPIALALMAYAFLIASRQRRQLRQFVVITVALLLACLAAFMVIYVIVGDTGIAFAIFDVRQQLVEPPTAGSMLHVFVNYIVSAIFPWSLPIIISLPWLLRHPRALYRNFLELPLLQRYALIVFLFSLPFLFFVTDLTAVLMLASIYFNMPLISRYLLRQSSQHTVTWKVAGYAAAAVMLAMAVLYAVVQWANPWSTVTLSSDGDLWSVALTAAVVMGCYTLWRNARSIATTNRFLYNIIFLYFATAALYAGYVIGHVEVAQ